MLPKTWNRHHDHRSDPSPTGVRAEALRLIAPIVLALVAAACGGASEADPSATSPFSAAPPTGTNEPGPIELDITVATASTTTTAVPADDWTVGGTITAGGVLAGAFEAFPLCDVRNDADGEFLNIAFGYQNLDDPTEPTVRVVAHVRGWRDQGDFETPFDAQYQTGTGIGVTFQDAAGVAQITIAFIDSVGDADVARIDLEGSFDGAVDGTVRADLTCIAG